MIIVSGRIYVHPGTREAFLRISAEVITLARRSPGCRDFVVAADPLEPNRVNVYEEWGAEEALIAFRQEGPDDDLSSSIVKAEVVQYTVLSSEGA